MKKIILFTLVILTFASNKFLLSQSSTPVMQFWKGGNLNVNFNFNFNSLDGGSGSGSFGRVISPGMSTGAASIFSNPAELALIKKPYLFFDSKLRLGLNLKNTINDKIKSSTTDFLKDTSTFIFNKSSFRQNSEVSKSDIANGGQLGTFAVAIPLFNSLVFGIGLNYPTDISLNLSGSGINTNINMIKKVGSNNYPIQLVISPSLENSFAFRMREISFGAGGELFNNENGKLVAGFSINKYDVDQSIYLNETFNGMMTIFNQEYNFNDPNESGVNWAGGESNNFYFRESNTATVSSIGYRFGLVYNPGQLIPALSNFTFSLAYDYVPKFVLTDNNAYSESYQPLFFKGRVMGDKNDPLVVNFDSLSLAKPNLTAKANNYFSQQTTIYFPSSISLGVDAKLGENTVAVNFVKYMNEFSYQFDKYKLGKNLSAGLKLGASFKMPEDFDGWNLAYLPLRILYLDFDGILMQIFKEQTHYKNSYYKISGGVLFGDAIVEGIFDQEQAKSLKDGLKMPLPSGFAITREYNVFDYVNVGVLVFGFPDVALKFGIGVQF